MSESTRPTNGIWTAIEKEKRRDRTIRVVSVIAWSITFVVLLVFAGMIGMDISQTKRAVAVGALQPKAVFKAAMPLVAVVGVLSLVIATLSTVGVFLRFRTASLTEIQLRLAALEAMLSRTED